MGALKKRILTHETKLCLGLSKQELCPQGEGHSLLNFAHEFIVLHYVDIYYKICFGGEIYLWPILEIYHLYC